MGLLIYNTKKLPTSYYDEGTHNLFTKDLYV